MEMSTNNISCTINVAQKAKTFKTKPADNECRLYCCLTVL